MPDERDVLISAAQLDDANQLLADKLSAVLKAIENCLHANLWEPSLILLYATIDALAWLQRPLNQPDVTAVDFVNWAGTYVLAGSTLQCSAEDLYGARCGLLHTHTGESRRHRELKVKKLFYHRVVEGHTEAVVQLRMSEKLLPSSVDLDEFAAAFRRGVDRFTQDLEADATRKQIVLSRIWRSYYSEVTMIYR